MKYCKNCSTRWEKEYYEYENNIYCFNCLLKELGISQNTITYYFEGNDVYGNSEDMEATINEVCEINNIKRLSD